MTHERSGVPTPVGQTSNATVALLAMPPSGETYFVRDQCDTVWLIHPPGAGEPTISTLDDVKEAVALHDWNRVDQSFANWEDLDRTRQVLAAAVSGHRRLDLARFDRFEITRLLNRHSDPRTDEQIRRATIIVSRLLHEAPLVREVDEIFFQATTLLNRLLSNRPTPQTTDPQSSSRRSRAYARMELPNAA